MRVVTQADKDYPGEVCRECGVEAAKRCGTECLKVSTYHLGTCGVCGRLYQSVTEPRDFGYPDFRVSDQQLNARKKEARAMEPHGPLQDLNIDNEIGADLVDLQLSKAIVFCDIDGILADCGHRIPYLKKKEYDKFYGPSMADDERMGLSVVALYAFLCGVSHLYNYTRFVLLTGRPQRTRSLTRLWLRDTYPHLFAEIIDLQDKHILCRGDNDWRPAHEVKMEKAIEYLKAETTCSLTPGDVSASEFVRGQFDMFFIDDDPAVVSGIWNNFEDALKDAGTVDDLAGCFHPILLDCNRLAKNYVPSKSSEE